MSLKIRAVAFDAVGTLIEPVPSVADAYRQAALSVGLDLPSAVIRERFVKVFAADDTTEEHSTNELNEVYRWRNIVEACLPELDQTRSNQAFDQLWEHFAKPSSWRLFPDVAETFHWLAQKGVKVCIASNFDARLRQVWGGLFGVDKPLDYLVISSEVGFRKPGEGFYKAVLGHLEEPPESVLFIGDDWINDVEFPAKFGFKANLLDRRNRSNRNNCFASLQELTDSNWFDD